MIIQYFSDIHLEFGHYEFDYAKSDVIVAAGDIGVGRQGVDWLKKSPVPVIYIAGNHEFYGGDLVYTRQLLETVTAETHIHYLENSSVEIDGTRFIGATLWTDYAGGDSNAMYNAGRQMNDYQQIAFESEPLSPYQIFEVNWESRFWLARELDEEFDGKTVVVTHHAPSFASWQHGEEMNSYRESYCNELDDLIGRHNIDLWIHGHIHQTCQYELAGTTVVCNPRGYHGYQSIDGFDLRKTHAI